MKLLCVHMKPGALRPEKPKDARARARHACSRPAGPAGRPSVRVRPDDADPSRLCIRISAIARHDCSRPAAGRLAFRALSPLRPALPSLRPALPSLRPEIGRAHV